MQKISESAALNIIKTEGEEFSITFTTADIARRKGGRRITSTHSVLIGSSHDTFEHGTFTIEMIDHAQKATVHRKLVDFLNGQKVIC
jgi:hypothetical protein